MNSVVLHGYAILFNAPFDQGKGDFEITEEGTFKSMIECGLRCQLQAGHHPNAPALACTKDGTLTLFEDETGLGFRTEIDSSNRAVLSGIASGSACRCSVNFTRWKREPYDGLIIVSDAVIDHIAIVPAAAYADTLVWRADIDHPPWRIQQWADKWQAGYEAALAKPVAQRVKTHKPAMASSSEIASERRLADRLRHSDHPSAVLLRNITLRRLERLGDK